MGTPAYLTVNGDVANGVNPFRPGIDSVGGAAKLDYQPEPPDPVTMLTANDVNQWAMLLVALAKVGAAALVYVKFSGSTPSVFGVRAMGSLLVTGDFALTDNGTGDTTVQCPATKIMQPFAGLAIPQTTTDIRAACAVTGTSDGIRTVTRNSSGTATDTDFLLVWF